MDGNGLQDPNDAADAPYGLLASPVPSRRNGLVGDQEAAGLLLCHATKTSAATARREEHPAYCIADFSVKLAMRATNTAN